MSATPERLSQQELESYLWGAANLLRGLIDAGDYKQYVFPLLFFKRLSDVWDDDCRAALDDTGDERYARATADDRFVIPQSAHWGDVRAASRDVGRTLVNAFRAIEAANRKRLVGIFGNASWTDKAQMPDETLKNLIEHFSQHSLGLRSVPEDELGNPPYSIKKWNREAWQSDSWGRNFLGTPPQGRADYAFFQHILKSLDPKTGRCAILFPHGVLFRNEEAEMRRKLVEADLVECVLGLGPNLFYNSPMEACIVVCRTQKPNLRQRRILFIDAVHEVARERAQSFLNPDHQLRILSAYRAFVDEPGFATVVDVDGVIANGGSLAIPRYVRPLPVKARAGSDGDLPTAWAAFDASGREFWQQMDELIERLDVAVTEETADAQ